MFQRFVQVTFSIYLLIHPFQTPILLIQHKRMDLSFLEKKTILESDTKNAKNELQFFWDTLYDTSYHKSHQISHYISYHISYHIMFYIKYLILYQIMHLSSHIT